MARAGDKLDAASLEVVIGIIEGLNFQLAAVAGTAIDLADGQRPAENMQDLVVQPVYLPLRPAICDWRGP
ncbi:MAG: hypothetical protein M0Q22_16210, partial [Sulfuritalea sp.]|nr:hypothetical protein [Sulfuritalea sp.]